MAVCENIIKAESKKLKIDDFDIKTPNKLNPEKSDEGREFANRLKNKDPDFLVVIAYGKIIPQIILDIPKIAPINIHGSLLPKYRGASPIQSIFLNNEKET
jgi:methionyl-tRNA formyltransferase